MAAPLRTEDTESLVALARTGDATAFGELYKSHSSLVRAVLRAHAPGDDVPDLTHETFLIALKNIRDVRDPRAFAGWISSIARNVARAHRRSTRNTEELNENIVAASSDSDTSMECERVITVLETLPDGLRQPLVMRLVDGMNGEEIAATLGVSHGAVRVSIHRGLKLLRKRLDVVIAAAAILLLFGALEKYGRALQPWTVVMRATNSGISPAIPKTSRVRYGDVITTDSASTARLNVGVIGRADIKPGSRVRIIAGSATDYRLLLEQGEMRARIWAPPRFFRVQTMNATAIDLGCIYTLRVGPDGSTFLKVEKGAVELTGNGKSLTVQAGDSAAIRVDGTAGHWTAKAIPFWERWREQLRALRGSNPQPSDPKSDALSN